MSEAFGYIILAGAFIIITRIWVLSAYSKGLHDGYAKASQMMDKAMDAIKK